MHSLLLSSALFAIVKHGGYNTGPNRDLFLILFRIMKVLKIVKTFFPVIFFNLVSLVNKCQTPQ